MTVLVGHGCITKYSILERLIEGQEDDEREVKGVDERDVKDKHEQEEGLEQEQEQEEEHLGINSTFRQIHSFFSFFLVFFSLFSFFTY